MVPYEVKYDTTHSNKYNSSSGYSSEALLTDNPTLVDPRMYGERIIWAHPIMGDQRGRRASDQSLGHIYESPDFLKSEGLIHVS